MSKLTPKQNHFLTALVGAPSVASACRFAGISTVWGWHLLRRDYFREALKQKKEEIQVAEQALGETLNEMLAIVRNPSVPYRDRVNAGRVAKDLGFKIRTTLEEDRKLLAAQYTARRKGKVLEPDVPKGYHHAVRRD